MRSALAATVAVLAAAAACSSGHGAAARPDPNTSIDVTGAIGSVRALELRPAAERLLGGGEVVSSVTRHPRKSGPYTLTRVRYPASGLTVIYTERPHGTPRVVEVFTSSARYRTADGLGVGSSLAKARREPGIRCFAQPGYVACQGASATRSP